MRRGGRAERRGGGKGRERGKRMESPGRLKTVENKFLHCQLELRKISTHPSYRIGKRERERE